MIAPSAPSSRQAPRARARLEERLGRHLGIVDTPELFPQRCPLPTVDDLRTEAASGLPLRLTT
jgi:hypothetical protein